LKWALAGLQRLRERGRFIQPSSSADAVQEMLDLASPIKAFIDDWCIIGPASEIETAELFEAWRVWCETQGRDHPGTVQSFGRDLRAAVAGVSVSQPRRDDDGFHTRKRVYQGISLTTAGIASVAFERSKRDLARNGTRDFA
jgi:putative DNA primase/helicase